MKTISQDSKWQQLVLSLVAGTAAAAIVWVAGAPEHAWLAYATAGLAWSTGGRSRPIAWCKSAPDGAG